MTEKKKKAAPAGAGKPAAGKAPRKKKVPGSARSAKSPRPARKTPAGASIATGKTLVIVESPSKAKTLNKI
ncbi:MAG: hypothetical protein RQ767_07405, partial [Thermovirgaceae bacterium]|nr:hypothetical protein [Thermovirgaceae bacterium]